jgi:hypothetical protein
MCASSVEACTSSFVIRDIPHPLSPLLSEKSANAGELRLTGRAGKFGMSGSLAMNAKVDSG